MKRDLHFEVVYLLPPEKVWRALADCEAIAQWLMPNDFAPRVGHKFQFRTSPSSKLSYPWRTLLFSS